MRGPLTPAELEAFWDAYAATMDVRDACRAAGIKSPKSIYARMNPRSPQYDEEFAAAVDELRFQRVSSLEAKGFAIAEEDGHKDQWPAIRFFMEKLMKQYKREAALLEGTRVSVNHLEVKQFISVLEGISRGELSAPDSKSLEGAIDAEVVPEASSAERVSSGPDDRTGPN